MSYRTKHRVSAVARRIERVIAGLPADPSNRERKAAGNNHCPSCKTEIRQPFQYRLHVALNGCQRVTP